MLGAAQDDVFALCDDRDGLITKQAFERLLRCGLEPRYVPEVVSSP